MMNMTECPSFKDIEFPRCDRDSALTEAANEGCLETVKKLLGQVPLYDKCELINESPIRCGDEDKWFSATPLVAASKSGHPDVTGHLLMEGADPSLICSPIPGVEETALSAAKNSLKQMEKKFRSILSGKHYIYDTDAWTDTDDILGRYFVKYRGLEKCVSMLEAAERYWPKSKYRDAKWSEKRQIAHKVGGYPNKPRQKESLIEEIRLILECETGLLLPHEELHQHYNKLLLDKRCELLELKITQNKKFGLVTPGRQKRNVVGILAGQRGGSKRGTSSLVRIPKRYIGSGK